MISVFSIQPQLDKSVQFEQEGWEKTEILYSTEIHNGVSYLCWKVKDTDHIFRILTATVYQKHGLEYREHFSITLKVFREDFLEWERQGFPEEWMKRYQRIFNHLIKR